MVRAHVFAGSARVALGAAVIALLAACAGSATTADPTVAPIAPTTAPATSAPRSEVVVYTSRAEALFKPVVAAFNAAYPDVTVTVLNGSNGELAARILEEQANPQADVLINSDTLTMASLAAQGAFEPNPTPAVLAVPLDYRAEDGSWVALTLRPRVIMYNTDLVKAEELPTKMTDLADPKWRGAIGSANSTNGAMMAQLVAMRATLGDAATDTFVRGLIANETQFFGSHTDVRKAVGAGELKLGLVNHYYYHLSKAEGAPVGIIYPDQEQGGLGLIVNSTNAGIIKNGPNPEPARLFVEFMLSVDGQQVYAEQNFEYPIDSTVALADGVVPLADFARNNVTFKTMWTDLDTTRALAQTAGLP